MSPTPAETVRAYLRAIENGDRASVLASYSPDAEQVEWPNRLNARGQRRGVAKIAEDFERGRALLASQRYEVTRLMAEGDHVMVEMVWRGTLAVAMGQHAAGTALMAHCAAAFDFRDGLIVAQRNYDCFEDF